MPEQHQTVGVLNEASNAPGIALDIDVGGQVVGGLAVDKGHIERQYARGLETTGAEVGDSVVVNMDDRANVRALTENFSVQVVADACHRVAVEDLAGGNIGDDDVRHLHLLE